MTRAIRSGVVIALIAMVLVGCSSTSNSRTAGQTIDDAKITATVKTELAKEKVSTLTKVDVDTNRGTVTLSGTVPDEVTKAKATDIARRVAGVHDVVNNLRVQ